MSSDTLDDHPTSSSAWGLIPGEFFGRSARARRNSTGCSSQQKRDGCWDFRTRVPRGDTEREAEAVVRVRRRQQSQTNRDGHEDPSCDEHLACSVLHVDHPVEGGVNSSRVGRPGGGRRVRYVPEPPSATTRLEPDSISVREFRGGSSARLARTVVLASGTRLRQVPRASKAGHATFSGLSPRCRSALGPFRSGLRGLARRGEPGVARLSR